MGTRTEFTDAAGNFSFPSLPPGVYTIDVEMEGFLPQRRSEVEVRLNRVTEIHMDLEPGEFTGEVTVVAQTPMVDPEQVSTSQSFSAEHIEESSIGSINRRYYAVLAQAPGVVHTTSVNPHVFGSTVAENVYYIDSIDSTDPVTSTCGVHVNFDTIQEINLETGGFEARYGRATGGVINVVTKSGGNDLSGTLDVRYRDTDFNTNGEHFDKDEDIFEYSRFLLGASPERCMEASPGERVVVNRTVPNWTADPQGLDPNGWFFLRSFAGEPNQIAAGLKPTFAEEAIVGVEMEVARRTSIGLTYVDKVTSDIFEDTCSGNWPTPAPLADCDYYVVANLPQLTRDYQGFLLDVESRFADWMHILASYVRSESRGNVEYYGYVSTDFDVYPDHFENRYGFLSDHRKHRVKVNGHLSLPRDFVVGFNVFWSSPYVYTPWTWGGSSYGLSYDVPRGSGEANENHRLDLQVAKGFRVGKDNRFELIASIYNALDDEQSIRVCTRSRGCWRDIEVGEPTRYREPRRFEAGVRFEF